MTATFPRLFPAADAGHITLPDAVTKARVAYDHICMETYTEPETHYDVLDRVVAETVTAVQAGTPVPDCAGIEDARRAEQVAADQADVLRQATETLAARVRNHVTLARVGVSGHGGVPALKLRCPERCHTSLGLRISLNSPSTSISGA
jgi:hypothetical protein